MSFIGREGRPAPKLKDAQLSSAELELAYEDVIRTMKTLYDDCHLVRFFSLNCLILTLRILIWQNNN